MAPAILNDLVIEVVYALPAEQAVTGLAWTPGVTVAQAIRQSGLMLRYPEIDLTTAPVGVFGKIVALDTPLKAGDRVEIYRPLTVDPKEARRRRVKLRAAKKSSA
jgi:uncharacterized protein